MLKVYWPLAKNTTILPAKISWNPEYGFPYTGRHPNKPSSAVLSPDIQCNVSFNNVGSVIFLSHLNMMRRVCDMFIKAKDGVYLKSQVTCRGGYSNLVSPLFQVLLSFERTLNECPLSLGCLLYSIHKLNRSFLSESRAFEGCRQWGLKES